MSPAQAWLAWRPPAGEADRGRAEQAYRQYGPAVYRRSLRILRNPEAARDALALPEEWLPHACVLVGHPDPAYVGRVRPPIPLDELRTTR